MLEKRDKGYGVRDKGSVVARFNRTLFSLTSYPLPPSIAIALSGGSDSLALLHLAHQTGLPIIALTIDHGLREESTKEAQTITEWMNALGIEHHILRWEHPAKITGNLQAEGRKARYRLLTEYCQKHDISTLLLGHTQDDQVETIAAMQERESGPVGLAGMSAMREENGITLLRPLLGHTRQELRDWLTEQSISWIDDPSNTNTDFTRIRIRQELSANPERKVQLLSLGTKMAAARQQIEAEHAGFVQANAVFHESYLTLKKNVFLELAQDQAAYTLGRILCHVGGNDYPPRYAKRLHLLEGLRNPTQARYTLAHCLIEWDEQQLIFRPEKDSNRFGTKPLVATPFVPIFEA